MDELKAAKYRKKPVVIEAVKFEDNGHACAAWCGGRFSADQKPSDLSDIRYSVLIPTLEGTMRADRGDWIIRGVKGEFYPCKPDIFEATYEELK